jgi:hypothetical protein
MPSKLMDGVTKPLLRSLWESRLSCLALSGKYRVPAGCCQTHRPTENHVESPLLIGREGDMTATRVEYSNSQTARS